MSKARVLVVDDSAVARGMITAALSEHPGIEVVGSANNGRVALSKVEALLPDIVVLDIEMPEMDGITALKHLRERHPKLPVVMFSTLSEHGARSTIEALAAGANDYALKPSQQNGDSIQSVCRNVLVPKLLSLTGAQSAGNPFHAESAVPTGLRPLPVQPVRPSMAPHAPGRVRLAPQVVAIASSTGGPNALVEIIPTFARDLPVPVLIVQHMPPIFTRCLAERLALRSRVKVIESEGNELLKPGMVYLAPGNRHLEVTRDASGVRTHLSDAAPENSCRPSADVLFRSVARVYGPAALCAVLTGMGSDGLLGAREVVQAGGRVLAQSGPTCVVWGMPKAVETAGLCEAVVPLSEMGLAIAQRLRSAGGNPSRTAKTGD